MIHLFTDFGPHGPYLGQMTAVLRRLAPEIPVIDLLNDAPAFDPRLAAYLLAALLSETVPGDIVMAVVDPGVGTQRLPLAVVVDNRWLVGPDNGVFAIAARRAGRARAHPIHWRPEQLSATFHGRDLFAPVAARLARGDSSDLGPTTELTSVDWPDDLAAIVYVDVYGNAITGLRGTSIPTATVLACGGRRLIQARTFGEVAEGSLFWYENSLGLVEIAANQGRAADLLGLAPGTVVELVDPRAVQ